MPITVSGTSITFNDATVQTTAATGSFVGPNAQVFLSSGTFTVPTGITRAIVSVFGGGGGGSGYGGCSIAYAGGSGGAARVLVTGLTPGASISVTVGGGGNGGAGAGAGSAGGTSSFGAYVSCAGGGGATTTLYGAVGSVTTSYQILQRTASASGAANFLGPNAFSDYFGGARSVGNATGGPGMSGGGAGANEAAGTIFSYAAGPGSNGNAKVSGSQGGAGGGTAGGTGGTSTGGGGGGTGGVIVEW